MRDGKERAESSDAITSNLKPVLGRIS